MKMKKILLVGVLSISLLSVSCSKDESTQEEAVVEKYPKTESFSFATDSVKIFTYSGSWSKKKEWHSFSFVKGS